MPRQTATPKSWVRVAASAKADTSIALNDAMTQLELPPAPRLVLVLASPRYDLAVIGAELEQRLPGCAVLLQLR